MTDEVPYEQILDDLKRVVGFRLPMYVAQAPPADATDAWKAGSHWRVRQLHCVVEALSATMRPDADGSTLSDEGVRSFLLCQHPDLGDRTPIDLLREGNAGPVVVVAESYVATGGVF